MIRMDFHTLRLLAALTLLGWGSAACAKMAPPTLSSQGPATSGVGEKTVGDSEEPAPSTVGPGETTVGTVPPPSAPDMVARATPPPATPITDPEWIETMPDYRFRLLSDKNGDGMSSEDEELNPTVPEPRAILLGAPLEIRVAPQWADYSPAGGGVWHSTLDNEILRFLWRSADEDLTKACDVIIQRSGGAFQTIVHSIPGYPPLSGASFNNVSPGTLEIQLIVRRMGRIRTGADVPVEPLPSCAEGLRPYPEDVSRGFIPFVTVATFNLQYLTVPIGPPRPGLWPLR